MHEFGPQLSEEIPRAKLISTIAKIRKDTESGKLSWKIIFNDKDTKIFSSTIYYTKSKYLTLYVKTSNSSKEENNNYLKIMYKIQDKFIDFSKNIILSTMTLRVFPNLIPLFKVLWKKYLGVNYSIPPDFRTGKEGKESSAIEVKDVFEYRQQILFQIRRLMSTLDKKIIHWEKIVDQIFEIHKEAEKSSDYNELNDFLFKATQLAKRHNPIGKPRWDNSSDDDDNYE